MEYTGAVTFNAKGGSDGLRDLFNKRGEMPGFVHVEHNEITKIDENLMHAARKDEIAKSTLVELCNSGYYIYKSTDGETRLVHHNRVRGFWQNVVSGKYQMTSSDVVYSYEPPISGSLAQLVVVFSPMSRNPFEQSINRHFVQAYPSLGKHLAPGTGVLRIGDLGGVKGAFYLDTSYLADNASNIADFIENFISMSCVSRQKVVLYGPSKGGTGSFYHSLNRGFHAVSVDPITADDVYENKYNDLHFTLGGIYPNKKTDLFDGAIAEANSSQSIEEWQRVVITSSKSGQKLYTMRHIEQLVSKPLILDSINSKITGHATIAANTMWAQVMAINSIISGITVPGAEMFIP